MQLYNFQGETASHARHLLICSRGRGYGIDFWQGFQIVHLGFYFKDYNSAIQISGRKRTFKRFWWLAPQKTENGTFLENR